MHPHIALSDIDPVPLDHFTLSEVVALLAAKITIRDVEMAPPPAVSTIRPVAAGPQDRFWKRL